MKTAIGKWELILRKDENRNITYGRDVLKEMLDDFKFVSQHTLSREKIVEVLKGYQIETSKGTMAVALFTEDDFNRIASDILALASPPDEDYPDIDFRRDIALEMSRDELIDRCCHLHESYTEMRKEWFEVVHIGKIGQQSKANAVEMPSEQNLKGEIYAIIEEHWTNNDYPFGNQKAMTDHIIKYFKSQSRVIDIREVLIKYEMYANDDITTAGVEDFIDKYLQSKQDK